jgi:uncharacterized protein
MSSPLSLQTARFIALAAQGLVPTPPRPAEKADVLATIRRLGALQIDTISVVARAPYLILWSRLGDYRPEWLDELLSEGALFEYWSHAMCFLPIEDYPYYRRFMLDGKHPHALKWLEEHAPLADSIRQRIRSEGGLRSSDFENKNHPPGGWWNWKEEKIALEYMFLTGELMISHRQGFQRVYDFSERVLGKGKPPSPALPPSEEGQEKGMDLPSRDEALLALTLKAVKALGIATVKWAPGYFNLPKTDNPARLEKLAEDGQILRVEVEGLGPAYLHPDFACLASGEAQAGLETMVKGTTLLSPFDPLISNRQRARDLFSFDYSIECYTPAPKRRYGYYTLPILQDGRLVGRLDPKAHRKEGVFEVKSVYFEAGVTLDDHLYQALDGALRNLAAWHGTPEIAGNWPPR